MRRRPFLAAAVAGAVALLASGCMGGGGDDAADSAVPAATAPAAVAAPVAVAPATLGGPVTAGPNTPKNVAAALKGADVIVVAFLVRNAADDQSVAASLRALQADPVSGADTRFFVYTVGKQPFGDLADVLGVEGTPSVAVIGRDRNLANLFTGLVDAEILRQAISDAADTAAANPAAAAGSGGSGTAAKTGTTAKASTSATGSAAGIALARKVNAAYGDVAGISITGSVDAEGFGSGTATGSAVLKGGVMTDSLVTVDFGDYSIESRGTKDGTYLRSSGSTCWAQISARDEDYGSPAIEMKGAFAAPVSAKGVTTLRVTRTTPKGSKRVSVYTIDPATNHITSQDIGGDIASLTLLDTAPSMPAVTPCANPAEAFDGVPSTAPFMKEAAQAGCERAGAPASACACLTDELTEHFPSGKDLREAQEALAAGDTSKVEDFAEMAKKCGTKGSIS